MRTFIFYFSFCFAMLFFIILFFVIMFGDFQGMNEIRQGIWIIALTVSAIISFAGFKTFETWR